MHAVASCDSKERLLPSKCHCYSYCHSSWRSPPYDRACKW